MNPEIFITLGVIAGVVVAIAWMFSRRLRFQKPHEKQDVAANGFVPAVQISESAVLELKSVRNRIFPNQVMFVRINCTPRDGGSSYGIEFVEDYDTVNDTILSKQGVSFVFDKASAKRLQGATIDFVNNETQAGFLFSNPNDS